MTSSSRETNLLNENDMATLIKVNQKLKELGIEKTIKLPQICVIGDQSAGKSSLIEALSKIKVPRAANCCTQCPLSINISSGEQSDSAWKCSITIEKRFEFQDGHRTRKPSKLHPMGPWSPVAFDPKVHTKVFKSTDDKYEVCELITAAQRAILNPDRAMKDFVPGSHARLPIKDTVKFSPNVVRIDITEGNQPSLSFIDLPGVISNTEVAEDQYLVDLVKNLVKEYAKNPETINILTLPMTNDIANSNSLRLIQIIQAEKRTMAVLTKPDRVTDAAEREQFLEKFLNQSDSLYQHGFHVCMMPPDVSLSYGSARRMEMAYFSKDPWASMTEELKSRLGVENVRSYIRELLFTKTREKLPENLRSIELRLKEIDARLDCLPAPPETSQLPFIIFRHLAKFEDNMNKLFSGHNHTENMTLRREFNQLCQTFQRIITESRPVLQFQTKNEWNRLRAAQEKISELSSNANRKGGNHYEPEEVPSGDEGSMASLKAERKSRTTGQSNNANGVVYKFNLDEIRSINRQYDNAGLPGQCYPQAKDDMMRLSVQGWNGAMRKFMAQVSDLIERHISEQKDLAFLAFKDYDLYDEIFNWVLNYFRRALQTELDHAESLCEVESTQPFTMNADTMAEKTEACLKDRVALRDAWRMKILEKEWQATGAAKPRSKQAFESHLPVDDYKAEVEMSASARAYYEIASSRFTDSICQGLLARLFPLCGQKLARDLQEHLGVQEPNKHETIIRLMREDPERQREREVLRREKNQLSEGKKYIETVLIHGQVGNGDAMDIDDGDAEDHDSDVIKTPQHSEMIPTFGTPTPTSNKRARSETLKARSTIGVGDNGLGEVEILEHPSSSPPESATKKVRHSLRNQRLHD